jgi:hypothetical protein
MYKKAEQLETESENFELPFGGKLAEDNRWVIMAKLIPWAEVEEEYAKKIHNCIRGTSQAKSNGIRGINNQRKIRDKR